MIKDGVFQRPVTEPTYTAVLSLGGLENLEGGISFGSLEPEYEDGGKVNDVHGRPWSSLIVIPRQVWEGNGKPDVVEVEFRFRKEE